MSFAEHVVCKVKRPRNPRFHRKFFALLHLVYQNQDVYQTFESFRKEVTMRAGYFEKHIHLTGQVSYVAKSLSFESMDETEFAVLYDKSVQVILEYFMPDTGREVLEEAVLDFVTEYSP